MSWNYRVVKVEVQLPDGSVEVSHGIHEVYYNQDGSLWGYTAEPVPAFSEDGPEGLRVELQRMLGALDKPVLTPEDFPKEIRDPEAAP